MPRPCLDPRIFIVLVIAASSPSSPWVLNVHGGLGPRLDSLNNSIFLQDPRSYNYLISMLLPCTMTIVLWFFIRACFSKYVHLVCSNHQASCQYLVHAGPMVETELCFHEHWSHALSFSGLPQTFTSQSPWAYCNDSPVKWILDGRRRRRMWDALH